MIRTIMLLMALLLFDWYAFQAVRLITSGWSNLAKTISYGIYWIIPLLAFGFMLLGVGGTIPDTQKNFFGIVRAMLIIIYGSKFLLVSMLVIDDLRRLLMMAWETIGGNQGFIYGRSKFLSQMGILLAGIPFVTLTYGILRNRYRYRVFKETVEINNLPSSLEGLKIVQISDIHSGSFTLKEPVRAAIDLINQQKADLVFFTGDLVNAIASEMDSFIDVFDKISAKFGVYSILGNHDYGDYVRWGNPEAKKANFNKLLETHRQLGWNLLLNENRVLDIENEKVAVIGVENYSASSRFPKYGKLAEAYEGTQGARLKLLLSHDPSHWDAEVTPKFSDIDITFSGHTHGFQFGIEVPGWIKWSPIKYVYKQWAGLYQKGQQYLYVNRGLGYLGYPGRVGILPEITVIQLKGDGPERGAG